MAAEETKEIQLDEGHQITFHFGDEEHGFGGLADIVQPTASVQVQPANQISSSSSLFTPPPAAGSEGSGDGEGFDDPSQPVHRVSLQALQSKLDISLDLHIPKNSKGLSEEEARKRLLRDGKNALTPPKELPEWVKYLKFYLDPFCLLLVAAGILSFIAYGTGSPRDEMNMYIGIILMAVTFVSSTFSYVQSGKASDVMKSFKTMLPSKCTVIRDGNMKQLNAEDLVVGDLVRVGTGDKVPADIRLIYASELKSEASSLTGESVPVKCSVFSNEEKIEEAKNVAFNTSQIVEGEGIGVVYATGDRSMIGTIAGLASGTKAKKSTLEIEIEHFVKYLGSFAVTLGLVFFIVGVGRGQKIIDAFINGFIVVVLANVPEGLPMTVTSALTLTAKRLGELNVFVKQLNCVETLGSANVIASDKTGTLTQNKMSVVRLWVDLSITSADSAVANIPVVTSSLMTMGPMKVQRSSAVTMYELETIAGVCNRANFADSEELTDEQAYQLETQETLAHLDPNMTLGSARALHPLYLSSVDPSMTLRTAFRKFNVGEQKSNLKGGQPRQILGDASETALFNYVWRRQNVDLLRYHNRKVFDLPFNSRNKFAITIVKPYHTESKDNRRKLLMKGAPEIVVTRCSHYMDRGEIKPIDDRFKEEFQRAYETFGNDGQRVLGFAELVLDGARFPPQMDTQYDWEKGNVPSEGLVFIGLMALVDPPKEGVPQAIAQCHEAGVRVIMVTGDHPLTAAAIARQVGIIQGLTKDEYAKMKNIPLEDVQEEDYQAVVVKGGDIPNLAEKDWNKILKKKEIVFARTTPQQKLEIVSQLQRLGNTVAVTGDGVNDSPALKKANIGVAMGISGSDVARDAASVILMDDDFQSIVVGIREGRTIFDNLTKTIAYTLTHMIPEVIPVLLNLIAGIPPGLSALLILFIDLGTELAPSVSLAYEKAESDVMSRPPRNAVTDRLVTWRVVGYALMAGMIECGVCYLAYFLAFDHHGISASALTDTADDHWKTGADPFVYTHNGNHQIITLDEDQQKSILAEAQTAYWTLLTTTQFCHIFVCKTRVLSVFEHGLFGNLVMNMGAIIEALLIVLIVFLPPLHSIDITNTFWSPIWALMCLSFGLIIIFNEARKWWTRKHPHGKIAKVMAW